MSASVTRTRLESNNSARTNHTAEVIERALQALALLGSAAAAQKHLARGGHKVSSQTITSWSTGAYAVRFSEICDQQDGLIAKVAAAEVQENVRAMTRLQTRMVEKLHEDMEALKPGELAGALRNVATSQALNMDKIVNPIRGRASSIVEHRSIEDLLRNLTARNLVEVIDSTAEITPQITDGDSS